MRQVGHSPKTKKKKRRQISETSEDNMESDASVSGRENENKMPEKVQRPTTRNDTHKTNPPEAENENRTVSTTFAGMRKQIEVMNEKIAELQTTNEELKTTCNLLCEENAEMKTVISNLKTNQEQILNEINSFEMIFDRFSSQILTIIVNE